MLFGGSKKNLPKASLVFEVPAGGGGYDDLSFAVHGISIQIDLVYTTNVGDDWVQKKFGILFKNFTAFRFRDEMHSFGYFVESNIGVCEIENSDWIAELKANRPQGHWYFDVKHFAVMLYKHGYLEVVCESVHPQSAGS